MTIPWEANPDLGGGGGQGRFTLPRMDILFVIHPICKCSECLDSDLSDWGRSRKSDMLRPQLAHGS